MNIDNEEWLIKDGVLLEYRGNAKEVVIPNGVVSIGDDVFLNQGIEKVTLPEGLKIINSRAFENNKLSEIKLPRSLESIGRRAFTNNYINNLVIPRNVTMISNQAFIGNNRPKIEILSKNIKFGNDMPLGEIKELKIKAASNIGDFDGLFDFSVVTVDCADATEEQVNNAIKNFKIYNLTLENLNFSYNINEGLMHYYDMPIYIKHGECELKIVSNTLVQFDGTTEYLKIPEGVNRIGLEVLKNKGIKWIDLPSTLHNLGDFVLADNQIETLNIPEMLTFDMSYFARNPLKRVKALSKYHITLDSWKHSVKNIKDLYFKATCEVKRNNYDKEYDFGGGHLHIDCAGVDYKKIVD